MHMLEQHMGQDHVSAQDQADENMAQLGSGTYLTKYKDEYLTVEMTSANQLTINPGSLLVNGRYCIIDTPEVLTVDNGSSGMTERDLVCVHWKEVEAEVQAASGDGTQTITKEEVGLVIVKGTPASSGATDPEISQDTIRSGVGEAWVPFARITKDGLTPSVALIVDKLAPESEFRTSIDHTIINSWHVYRLPNGLAAIVRNATMNVQADEQHGDMYYHGYTQPFPSGILSEVLYADVRIVRASGLWGSSLKSVTTSQLSYYATCATQQSSVSATFMFLILGMVIP